VELERIDRQSAARAVAVGAALLLVVDLFLDWRRVSVEVAGFARVAGETTGWSAWGKLAGAAAIALVAWELLAPRSDRFSPLTIAGVSGLLSLVVLVGTVQVLFATDVSLDLAGVVLVQTGERLWAAWAGLGLAVVLVASSAARLAATARAARDAEGSPSSVGAA